MNRIFKALAIAALLSLTPLRQFAQQPYRQYADEGIMLNFFEIGNPDLRLYLLYNIGLDDRFSLLAEDEYGQFIVNPSEDHFDGNFFEAFESFYNNAATNFRMIDKVDLDRLVPQWKERVPAMFFTSITMDLALNRAMTENNHCVDSDPFCTSDVITFNAANTSQTADQLEAPGVFDDGCIGSSYNPSWYHMRINTGGQFIIHMEGHDPWSNVERDIDFCMWGPFEHPTDPCVAQLTTDKIIDCNYSSSYSEDIFLGYSEGQHVHNQSHGTITEHTPETGEYYILMITNYSREPCVISFTKTEGSGPGTTDCGILPGIATNDGPYCVGETIHLSVTTQAGATYSWTGPNNFTSTSQSPTLPNCTMEMAGTYTCVTTVDGQTTTGSTEVVIYAMPVADFEFTAVCEGTPTQFTSTATTNPLGHEITSYEWDFGDGTTDDTQNPTHTYAAPGTYNVTHTVQTGRRCVDEITLTVTVYTIPTITVTSNPTQVIFGGTATLTANATPAGNYTYHWEPANMVTNPNSQTTQTVPLTSSQVYTVTVTSVDGGCTSTQQIVVNMEGSDMTATATAEPGEICEDGTTTLHAYPINGTGNYTYTYNWTPANLLNNANVQHPIASPPLGQTEFSCTISDGIATQIVNVTVTVYPKEEQDLYESICANETYNFFGQVLNTSGVYTHHLQTQHGCDSLLRLNLTVNPLDAYEFTVPIEESCDEYFWDPQGHEIVATDHDGLTYDLSGDYERTYKNHMGCDSVVKMHVQFNYTPAPTPIYPMDPANTAPHWVVPSTEFQINTYDFELWDTNPNCNWDTVTWSCDEAPGWPLEPFGLKGQSCKVYVLEHVDDTIWLKAHAFNRCSPNEGIEQKYWLISSFYGVEEQEEAFGFDVIPNPNNGQMALRFESLTGRIFVKVYDMRGVLVDEFETFNGSVSSTHNYQMKPSAGGIYFFVATSKEGTVTRKVVVESVH